MLRYKTQRYYKITSAVFANTNLLTVTLSLSLNRKLTSKLVVHTLWSASTVAQMQDPHRLRAAGPPPSSCPP